jgi:hypothetical protein
MIKNTQTENTMSKNPAAVRKAAVRKNLQKQINALTKIEAGIIKARLAIESNSESLNGDTYNQIADIFGRLNIAITVVDSARQDAAHKLVNTLTGK